MDSASAHEILRKIEAISNVNAHIISRLQKKRTIVVGYSYEIEHTNFFNLEVKEKRETMEGSELLDLWKTDIKLTVVPNPEGLDTIDYSCSTFQDLLRLNQQMLSIARLYHSKSSSSYSYLNKFLENYELIQVELGSLEELMFDSESKYNVLKSQVDEVKKKLDQVIADAYKYSTAIDKQRKFGLIIKQMKLEKEEVNLTWDPYHIGSSLLLSNGNKTVTGNGIGWVCQLALASCGWSEGVHYWEIRVDKSNDDMIGIMPLISNLRNTSRNYETNGFFFHHSTGIYGSQRIAFNLDIYHSNIMTIVGMLLSFKDESLTVFINGDKRKKFSISHLQERPLYPAVELFSSQSRVTLVKYEKKS